VLSAKHIRIHDHDRVLNIIDAVVAETKAFSEVAGMKRERERERERERDGAVTLGGNAFHVRVPATGNARSPIEDRRVAGTTSSVLELSRTQSLARMNTFVH